MNKYEEALAKARAGKSLEEIFPEMKESEDERIRKCLIDMVKRETGFTGFPSQGQVLTFLEKQKEQPTDEEMLRTLRVEYEKGVADTIAKYEREQTEELSTRLNGLMPEYVKSGKDEQEQEHRLKCYKLFWDALEDSEFFEQFKQKEQKPVAGENPQTSAEILRHYLVWAGNSEEDCPYTWKTLADAIRDGIKALEEQKEQKPAEWSEEDEDMLNSCISSIEEAKENRYAYKETDGDTSYDHEIAWLKSIRPQPHTVSIKDATKFGNLEYERGVKDGIQSEKRRQWKPSEEQMEALKKVAYGLIGSGTETDIYLAELYEQLKKLM